MNDIKIKLYKVSVCLERKMLFMINGIFFWKIRMGECSLNRETKKVKGNEISFG